MNWGSVMRTISRTLKVDNQTLFSLLDNGYLRVKKRIPMGRAGECMELTPISPTVELAAPIYVKIKSTRRVGKLWLTEFEQAFKK